MNTLIKVVHESPPKVRFAPKKEDLWGKYFVHPEIMKVIEKKRLLGVLWLIKEKCGETDLYHALGVAENIMFLAYWMRIVSGVVEKLIFSALLHDIGRVFLKENYSKKLGKLSPDERKEMNKHPGKSFEYLVAAGELLIAEIVIGHHEYTKGYPRKKERRDAERINKWILLKDRRSGRDRREDKSELDWMKRLLAIADIFHSLKRGCPNGRAYVECKDSLETIHERYLELACFRSEMDLRAIYLLKKKEFVLIKNEKVISRNTASSTKLYLATSRSSYMN